MDAAWAWRVLGVTPGSPPDDVRRAFRRAAQILHPDRVSGLPEDVRAEAHRRMVELGDAYRTCLALANGGPAPRARVSRDATPASADFDGAFASAGDRARDLLADAKARLASVRPWEAYRRNHPTPLDRDTNATVSRAVVTLLEQVARAWPGTAEGEEARLLLVTSAAAVNSLSPRERAGHLVLVVDADARSHAWDGLAGRDALAVAQVAYAHPTASDDVRRDALRRLVEFGDWATLASDPDRDVRETARAHLLIHEGRLLAERARWIDNRDGRAFDADHSAWRDRVDTLVANAGLPLSLAAELRSMGDAVGAARKKARV